MSQAEDLFADCHKPKPPLDLSPNAVRYRIVDWCRHAKEQAEMYQAAWAEAAALLAQWEQAALAGKPVAVREAYSDPQHGDGDGTPFEVICPNCGVTNVFQPCWGARLEVQFCVVCSKQVDPERVIRQYKAARQGPVKTGS
jgi:hypothetical protein